MRKKPDAEKVQSEKTLKLLSEVVSSFVTCLDKPFVSEYGSLHDRIKAIVEANQDFVSKILSKRPDLTNNDFARCLISTKKYLRSITKEQKISRVPPHASTKEDFREELVAFLESLLKERFHMSIRKSFSGVALKRVFNDFLVKEYLRYEKYLYNDSVSDFVICPLGNFIGPQTMMDFGNHLTIRKITQDEFHSLVEAQKKNDNELRSYTEFVLYIPGNRNWTEHSSTIITALRLLKKGTVGLSRTYQGYAFPFKPWNILEPPMETKFFKEKTESLYKVNNQESDGIIRLVSALENVRNTRYLSVALRRFNLLYQRDRLEDRFIDCFVSLESLYSKPNVSGEVTHRISTRAARVLTGTFDDRRNKRKRIKDLYRIRSKIVHGARDSVNQADVYEAEGIARKSLNWFITHEEFANHEKIIDELDLGS